MTFVPPFMPPTEFYLTYFAQVVSTQQTTEIKVALRMAGTPIGPNDTAIAGHAIAASAVLVTNNVREFEKVPGLVLEDWAK